MFLNLNLLELNNISFSLLHYTRKNMVKRMDFRRLLLLGLNKQLGGGGRVHRLHLLLLIAIVGYEAISLPKFFVQVLYTEYVLFKYITIA